MDGTWTSPILASLPRGFRVDRNLGVVYDHAPPSADDLTIIAGIETREAVSLNQLGVYFVAQISLWRHHEIAAFSMELKVPQTTITEERWVEQARSLSLVTHREPEHHTLPASVMRTIGLLTCALLVGFLAVYVLGNRYGRPLHGVLSADITAIRVPASSKLLSIQVKPGDEVFSGEPLLTLEKNQHVAMINEQQKKVNELNNELQTAEAQASLELSWRIREVDRELYDVRTQHRLVQEVRKQDDPHDTRRADRSPNHVGTKLSPVSSSQVRNAERPRAGSLLFFSGTTNQSTLATMEDGLPPKPNPLPAPVMVAQAKPASVSDHATMPVPVVAEAVTLESRISRLEELRGLLPDQIKQAAGIEHLRTRCQEATAKLQEMQSVSREVAITSPVYGTVGQIRYREGDSMQEGETMLKILHTDRRYVIVYVPTRRVNELQPGSTVQLQFPGRQSFEGQVTDLPMLAEAMTPGGETLAAVRIEQTGKLWPQVPIGSQVDVTVGR